MITYRHRVSINGTLPLEDQMSRTSGTPNSEGPTGGTPTWVKVLALIAIVVVVAFIVSLLAGVQHGPALHEPSSGTVCTVAAA
jgi:hypothetical protein